MEFLKKILANKYVMGFIKVFCMALILTFVLTLLNYFGLLNNLFLNIFKILIPLLSLLFGSYHIGKRSKVKGWLEGIKLGAGISVLVILFNLLGLARGFDLKLFVYVVIIMAMSILGGMLGITKTKET